MVLRPKSSLKKEFTIKVLFYDTETNSLDTKLGFVQELAWAVFDANSKRLLWSRSDLLKWNMHYAVDPGALATTGLSREYTESHGRLATEVFSDFLLDVEKVDALCGHNQIDYDKEIVRTNIRRSCFGEPEIFMNKYDFDTMYDLPYPPEIKLMNLEYLAMKHGMMMTGAHQALADVLACAHIFFKYPLREVIAIANTPLVTIHGYTEFKDQKGRDAFYAQKFRWNRDNKRYEKRCRSFYIKNYQLSLNHQLFVGDKKVVLTDMVPAQADEPLPF